MYDLDFSCSSIFHQLWAHNRPFKDKKVQLIFHPVFALFSLSGRLPKAITTHWKCSLRVPWWNTFQWGPRKPPKPLLAKKNSRPKNPKSHSQPSVHCKFKVFDFLWFLFWKLQSKKHFPSSPSHLTTCHIKITVSFAVLQFAVRLFYLLMKCKTNWNLKNQHQFDILDEYYLCFVM